MSTIHIGVPRGKMNISCYVRSRKSCIKVKALKQGLFHFDDCVYSIKQGNNHISIDDNCATSYIIGFTKSNMARHVMHTMHPMPSNRLIRSEQVDITRDINNGLKTIGINNTYLVQDLKLDTNARLLFQKYKGDCNQGMNPFNNPLADGGFHLDSIKSEDFLSYPFSHNLGIIIPLENINETDEHTMYSCMVVDPAFNEGMFKAQLSRILKS